MTPDIIREIAETIVRDQILLNWRFYALISGISLVATAIASWLTSYFKKRGETLATKSDMQEILKQLHDTTRVAEEVRATVSHADWVAREWRTIRRLKLEELLSSAYAIDRWLDFQKSKWVYGKSVEFDEAPMDRLKIVAGLYFPELASETKAVWLSHQQAYLLILEIAERTNAANQAMDLNAHQAALNDFSSRYKPLYEAARIAISALEDKASKLMVEVARA